MAKNQVPNDGQSLERRRERKRTIESDNAYEVRNRCKAIQHRAKVGDQLPAMYAKGSLRYACAFRGRAITTAELDALRDSFRKPDVPTDAAQ